MDELIPYPEKTLINPVVHQNGYRWVLRGGSWFSAGRSCRSAYRPVYRPVDQRGHFGFRLARGLADQSRNAVNEIIELLGRSINIGWRHEIIKEIDNKIIDSLNCYEVSVNYSSSFHVDLDQVEVRYRSHEYVLDKNGRLAVDALGFEDGLLSLCLRLVVKYDVNAWFDISAWDSVDREYISMGASMRMVPGSGEAEVTLSLRVDSLNGVGGFELGEVDIDLDLPAVDIGDVEPDMHDD